MPHYLVQFSYASRSIKTLIERPDEDHAAGASGLVSSLGGRLLGYWYAFGDFDGVVLIEAPDNSAAAAVAMAVGGTGEVSRLQTTVLLTMDEAQRAMHSAATATHLPPGDGGPMSTPSPTFRAPIIDPSATTEIADGVWVIPDANHVRMVPNIGIIVGLRATLVIDTGFGPENARVVLQKARSLSGGRPIFLTHTHCHPEHGFGANVVAGDALVVYNDAQWDELQEKGPTLLRMFRENIPALAPMLEGVEFTPPDIRYTGSLDLDLGGGRIVEFREYGGAHSRGDQGIVVRGSTSVLFTGDLVEEGYFSVLGDHESHVVPWIDRLQKFEKLGPQIVVPGHGHVGGPALISTQREYFELAKRRVHELRAEGKLREAEIVDLVGGELLALHPDWGNPDWAKKTVANLSWPSRR